MEEPGYEADDLIAQACQQLPEEDQIVIVSNDQDLYQLLSDRVSIFKKGDYYRADHFWNDYDIEPAMWPRIKAVAGCSSDNIKGVRRIGVATAVKYVKGVLNQGVCSEKIAESQNLIDENLKLVELPFEGTPRVQLTKDKIDLKEWQEVCNELGLEWVGDRKPGRRKRKWKHE